MGVRLGVERDNFVQNEPILLDAYIDSNHNRAIILGNEPGWIQFSIRNGSGFPVNKMAPLPRGNLFVLRSRKSAVKGFNLAPYFDFSEVGEYTIQASIKTGNWSKRFYCRPVKIQVVRARVLGVRRRGTAGTQPGAEPVVRRYTLQTTRVKGKSHLFLRVSDDLEPSVTIYNVEPLGTMVHSARPQFALDEEGESHVFFQSHMRQFFYCRIERQRPYLTQERTGRFKVQGGRRVVGAGDFPEPRALGLRKN